MRVDDPFRADDFYQIRIDADGNLTEIHVVRPIDLRSGGGQGVIFRLVEQLLDINQFYITHGMAD